MAASQLVSRASIFSPQFPREPTPPAFSPFRSLRFPTLLARTKNPRFGVSRLSNPSHYRRRHRLHCFSKGENGLLYCEGVRVPDAIEAVERICSRCAWRHCRAEVRHWVRSRSWSISEGTLEKPDNP